MGQRGPVPKRSSQRRRTNKESRPRTAPAGDVPSVPEANDKWHPVARAWFESLARSGQSRFYEASDWATAVLIAESISRDLKPQVVGVNEETNEPVLATIPLKGASLAAYLKAMGSLLVTEGDRRRVQLELERPAADSESVPASPVASFDEYKRRLSS